MSSSWRAAFLVGLLVVGSGTFQPLGAAAEFRRGDANLDGRRDLSDAVQILLCTFAGRRCASCTDAADVNDDGVTDIADPIGLLGFLFAGGPPLPAPASGCGQDPTVDALACQDYPGCPSEDTVMTSRGVLTIIPIEHASLVMRWAGKTIYVDPVGGRALFAHVPAPDIVLVTHTHSDHLDATTLAAVVVDGTVLVAPATVVNALAGSPVLGVATVTVLANGGAVVVGDIGVEAVPMYNVTAGREQYHPKGAGNGYVLDLAGTRVYISGDTEDTPEMRALPDIDLAFVCMNLPYTMTTAQAASAVLAFRPAVVYPYHYRGQDPELFKSSVEAGSDAVDVRVRNWYP